MSTHMYVVGARLNIFTLESHPINKILTARLPTKYFIASEN